MGNLWLSLRCGGAASGHDPRDRGRPYHIRQLPGRGGSVWWQGQGGGGGLASSQLFRIVINIGCMFFGSLQERGPLEKMKKVPRSLVLPLHICMGKRKGRRQSGQRGEGGAGGGRKSATQLHKFVYLWLFLGPRESQAEQSWAKACKYGEAQLILQLVCKTTRNGTSLDMGKPGVTCFHAQQVDKEHFPASLDLPIPS